MTTADPNLPNPPNPNPNPPADPPADPPNPDPELVKKEAYDQVKADLFKQKEENRKLKEEQEKARLNTMREKEDWQGIAKQKEEEAETWKSKYQGLSEGLVENAKHNALKNAALKAGILDQSLSDLELLDFTELGVETTSTGKIIVTGADQAIDNLKKRKPHWFGNKVTPVNPSSPETLLPTNGRITFEQLEKIRVEYQKDPGNAAKKDAYEKAIYTFKTQT